MFPALLALPAAAAPYRPQADSQVLATVLARASDPRAQELLALRAAWRAAPQDLDRAVALAQRYFEQVAAEGDPRYIGYAQAALQPWWDLTAPPVPVRVLRAMLLQFDHRFESALADLAAALQAQPDNGAAWSWQTAILMVRADYDAARRSCAGLAPLATPLVAAACRAQVDAVTGHAAQAAATLRSALQLVPAASADERLWALTRLAETEERRGEYAAAEKAFNDALNLGVPDVTCRPPLRTFCSTAAARPKFCCCWPRAAAPTCCCCAWRWRPRPRRALRRRPWPPSWPPVSTPRASAATPATARKNRVLYWRCRATCRARWPWRGRTGSATFRAM